MNLHSSWL